MMKRSCREISAGWFPQAAKKSSEQADSDLHCQSYPMGSTPDSAAKQSTKEADYDVDFARLPLYCHSYPPVRQHSSMFDGTWAVGQYVVKRCLGRGSYGEVREGIDTRY